MFNKNDPTRTLRQGAPGATAVSPDADDEFYNELGRVIPQDNLRHPAAYSRFHDLINVNYPSGEITIPKIWTWAKSNLKALSEIINAAHYESLPPPLNQLIKREEILSRFDYDMIKALFQAPDDYVIPCFATLLASSLKHYQDYWDKDVLLSVCQPTLYEKIKSTPRFGLAWSVDNTASSQDPRAAAQAAYDEQRAHNQDNLRRKLQRWEYQDTKDGNHDPTSCLLLLAYLLRLTTSMSTRRHMLEACDMQPSVRRPVRH